MFRTASLVLMLAVVAPARADDEGKKYAVLVGVNEYDHAKLDQLRYAEADAAELRDVLQANGYETTLLTGTAGKDDANAAPTKANIAAKVAAVLDGCKRTTPS